MTLQTCKVCGEFAWTMPHKCDPMWLVWLEDDGRESASKVFASDPIVAAEHWAADYDEEEHDLDHAVAVLVEHADGTVARYLVYGECEIHYYARFGGKL